MALYWLAYTSARLTQAYNYETPSDNNIVLSMAVETRFSILIDEHTRAYTNIYVHVCLVRRRAENSDPHILTIDFNRYIQWDACPHE